MKAEINISIPDKTAEGTVPLAHGICMGWLNQGQLVYFEFENGARDAADAFYAAMRQVIEQHEKSRPLLILNDYSSPNFIMTPYLRQKIEAISTVSHEAGIRGRAALYMSQRASSQIMSIFTRISHAINRNKPMAVRLFTSQADATAWLEELLTSA